MAEKALSEQILDYLRRSGDEMMTWKNLIWDEHGFMSWDVRGEVFVILTMYGDGKYWDQKAQEMAQEKGCTRIRAGTKRNPKPFERRLGYKQIGYILEKKL